jgi:GNAT superfamily N-acetyltransferase
MTQIATTKFVTFRSIAEHDEKAWKHMIVEYDPDNVNYIDRDWERLISGTTSAQCYIALVDEAYAGFVHTITHEFIFHRRPCRYLADLYVRPAFRRKGIARSLIQHVLTDARINGCGRVYWLTHENNPARSLYNEFARSEFVRYEVDF